jgi:hypothetical protein
MLGFERSFLACRFGIAILMPRAPKQPSFVLYLARQHRTANRRQPSLLPLEFKLKFDLISKAALANEIQ